MPTSIIIPPSATKTGGGTNTVGNEANPPGVTKRMTRQEFRAVDIATEALSNAGEAKLVFNSVDNELYLSENGGAFVVIAQGTVDPLGTTSDIWTTNTDAAAGTAENPRNRLQGGDGAANLFSAFRRLLPQVPPVESWQEIYSYDETGSAEVDTILDLGVRGQTLQLIQRLGFNSGDGLGAAVRGEAAYTGDDLFGNTLGAWTFRGYDNLGDFLVASTLEIHNANDDGSAFGANLGLWGGDGAGENIGYRVSVAPSLTGTPQTVAISVERGTPAVFPPGPITPLVGSEGGGLATTMGNGGESDAGTAAGDGGEFIVTSGAGGATATTQDAGQGGDITLETAAGGDSSGDTGDAGQGGDISLLPGDGGDADTAGAAGGEGGDIYLTAGHGGDNNDAVIDAADGGHINLQAGNGGVNAGAGNDGDGGYVQLDAGSAGGGTGQNGVIEIGPTNARSIQLGNAVNTEEIINVGPSIVENQFVAERPAWLSDRSAVNVVAADTEDVGVIEITDTSVARTVQLDSQSTAVAIAGYNTYREYIIKDGSGAAGTNPIAITGLGGETIDGAATYYIERDYGFVHVVADGTNWKIVAEGVEEPFGEIYVDTALVTNVAANIAAFEILGDDSGATTLGETSHFTNPSVCRLTYTGKKTRKFKIIAVMTSTHDSVGGAQIAARLAIGGVTVAKTEQRRDIGTGGDVGNWSCQGIIELDENDYVEVYVASDTAGNVTTSFLTMTAEPVG